MYLELSVVVMINFVFKLNFLTRPGKACLINYDIRFNCCNATRPILNKAQEAAANNGNKTTKSLVSAIEEICVDINNFSSYYYYTSFLTLVFKIRREFFYKQYLEFLDMSNH